MRMRKGSLGCLSSAASALALLIGAHAVAGSPDALERKLPDVPRGVTVGMNVADLLKARPDAEEFRIFEEPNKAGLDKGEHLLLEQVKETEFFSTIGYSVKDGRCDGLTLEGHYEGDMLRAKRRQVLRAFLKAFGEKYERGLKRKGLRGVECLAPVFLWRVEGKAIALLVTAPEYPGVKLHFGSFHLMVCEAAVEKKFGLVDEERHDPELLAELFAALIREAQTEPEK